VNISDQRFELRSPDYKEQEIITTLVRAKVIMLYRTDCSLKTCDKKLHLKVARAESEIALLKT
jgi:hypothetical protein